MIDLKQHEPGVPVTKPGLYAIDEADYHADRLCEMPSLSSTLARVIINETPLHAWYGHPRLNEAHEESSSGTMDVGKAHHAMLLGSGRDVGICDYKDWKTNAAKAERDAVRESGLTPILKKDFLQAEKLVALARRQVANFSELPDLLGRATIFEHAAVWKEKGFWCRALMDIVRIYPDFVAIVDFKSTERSASPSILKRQVFQMGYDVQMAFYRRGVRRILALLGVDKKLPVRCFMMVQERAGPGALSITELDEDVLTLADKKVVASLALWKTCLERNEWPAYPPFVSTITLPPYIERDWLEREVNDDALAGAGWDFALPIGDPAGERMDPTVLRAG